MISVGYYLEKGLSRPGEGRLLLFPAYGPRAQYPLPTRKLRRLRKQFVSAPVFEVALPEDPPLRFDPLVQGPACTDTRPVPQLADEDDFAMHRWDIPNWRVIVMRTIDYQNLRAGVARELVRHLRLKNITIELLDLMTNNVIS